MSENKESEIIQNFTDIVDKTVVRFNKSMVLDFVTAHSFEIIDQAVVQLQNGFDTIVAAFEEIQASGTASSSNTGRVNTMMSDILNNNKKLQSEINERVSEIEEASVNAKNAASNFELLKEKTADVAGMLAGIQDVSVKTGILAINASIEAARAGKVGSGFRIIANEVRALATQTGESTKKIEEKLTEFRETVDEINKDMTLFIELFSRFQQSFTEVLNNFNQNASTLDRAGNSLSEIAAAVQEQAGAMKDGLDSLEKVNGSLHDTHTILDVIQTSYSFLDTLLGQKQ
ncbi:methyl-accepting chemotaxis protein [Treponema sp. Marseille-Q4130]|uniref:methyl-accepting chemotaxis protein n=1 Tax=Treponema sp. Marseille-Q4130 TaxID=2766702 RepID=UPI001651B8A7|nr:methyl-accepting chemotaxis protein [Treponema sp. Marseille-Q4130]MBC6719939.1 methyl-accepting chemotaxis protein [Treponema sp. Marseille-Q4130]